MDEQTPESVQPRRSMRARRTTANTLDFDVLNAYRTASEDFDYSDYEDDVVRPATDTVSTNAALAGKEIYGFNKVKKHDRLLSTARTENRSRPQVPKTPRHLRQQLGKKIKSKMRSSSSKDEDDLFAESDSDYFPSGSESSESDGVEALDDEDEIMQDDSDDSPVKKSQGGGAIPKIRSASATTRGKGNKYVIKTEEYFSQTASKAATSNHTLDKLTTPRLSQDQLQQLLSQMKLSECHQRSIMTAARHNKEHFSKWLCLLNENFNVLLYGLGSKQSLLNDFHSVTLTDEPVIVINGYFPSLTLKDILDAIVNDLLELDENTANVYNAVDVIAGEFRTLDSHLYLIVHNIEGGALRNAKCQDVLSRLSAIPNVHLIASIDHINAPLIWDHNKLSKFNFVWFDVTSFLPYADETSFESSMVAQRTGNLALSSLRNVFLSLTSNSKGIYMLIITYQLEHNTNQYYQGMLFKDLYTACREAFLVSSDLALRAQLTEFVDHKMVRLKRSADGAEYLMISIANNLLQQFRNEQNK